MRNSSSNINYNYLKPNSYEAMSKESISNDRKIRKLIGINKCNNDFFKGMLYTT